MSRLCLAACLLSLIACASPTPLGPSARLGPGPLREPGATASAGPQGLGMLFRRRTFGVDPYENQIRRGTGYGGIELMTGIRSLPEATYGRVRTQGLGGVQVLVPFDEGPLAIELGASYSHDDEESVVTGVALDGRLFEASLGLRLSFGAHRGTLVPYVGCGLAGIYTRLEDEVLNERRDDSSGGVYAKLGLMLYVAGNEYVSLEWRGTDGMDLSLFNASDSADYHQVTINFGYSW